MKAKNETPKTLRQAIINGACNGPARYGIDTIQHHVKDFLSQKFQTAILVNPELESKLLDLWIVINKEDE